MTDVPKIVPDKIATLAQTRFVSLYDLAYEDGSHYFDASRRQKDDLLACWASPRVWSTRLTSRPQTRSCVPCAARLPRRWVCM